MSLFCVGGYVDIAHEALGVSDVLESVRDALFVVKQV